MSVATERVARCVCGGSSAVLDMPAGVREGYASHVYEAHIARYAAQWHDAHVMDSGRRVGVYVLDSGHEVFDLEEVA